jgi:membrane protein YdbS with pleckstrin-like domain/DNA-directed RNA polymerase subunit RPC12/RpoP
MNTIKYECPHCHEIITGDDSSYGREITCPKCQAAMLVPETPVSAGPQTARLIKESRGAVSAAIEESSQETDLFKLSPVARAFPVQIVLSAILMASAILIELHAHEPSWPQWAPLIPLAPGLLLLLMVWIQKVSCEYRLTNQRLFVRNGWLAKKVNELELYRVEDVQVDQGILQRLLRYGTITVQAADVTTPQVQLIGISRPVEIKEMIRTQYRAARKREGVTPTEFMQSPNPTQTRATIEPPPSPAAPRRE